MKRLVPAKRMGDYEAEVYGVIRPEGSKYFPAKIVEAIVIKRKVIERSVLPTHPIVYITIDPASHLRSTMGLSAISYGTEGQVIVIGIAAVQVAKCEILQIQMVITGFVHKVCKHPWFQLPNASPRIVPIIECNNNEIVANSILSAIRGATVRGKVKMMMPFTRDYFSTGITENLGVCFFYHSVKLTSMRFINVFCIAGMDYRYEQACIHTKPVHNIIGWKIIFCEAWCNYWRII